jgi:hypothetical protein
MSVPDAGLCLTCRFVRLVPSLRDTTYYRCGRSDADPSYPRFPRLPVVRCPGHEPRSTKDTPADDDRSL